MKILHIGREENLERYPAPDSLTGEIQKASLPMGKSTEEYLKAMRDAEVIIADGRRSDIILSVLSENCIDVPCTRFIPPVSI